MANTKKKVNVAQTLKDRKNTHGEFADHAMIAQRLKLVLTYGPRFKELNDMQRESLDMICHKIARIVAGNPDHKDHWHDIAGYATLVEERIK